MAHTITEDATDRRVAFELLKNELDHRLRLLVRVLDHVAAETPHIAHGDLHAELPALRFGPLAREHPLFEHMTFSFRHSPLQS